MKWLLFFFLISFSVYAEPIPVFHPPDDWEFAHPTAHSSFVKVGFLGKGSTPFRPSINMAIEIIDVNAKEYLKAVKEIHLAEPETSWRDLGRFTTKAGEARLTEITNQGAAGEIKMLQMILVKGSYAYILTGAAIKQDYLNMQGIFTKTFQSFALTEDLISLLSQSTADQVRHLLCEKEVKAKDKDGQRQDWEFLQKIAEKESSRLGKYWQLLILKQGYETVYSEILNIPKKSP